MLGRDAQVSRWGCNRQAHGAVIRKPDKPLNRVSWRGRWHIPDRHAATEYPDCAIIPGNPHDDSVH